MNDSVTVTPDDASTARVSTCPAALYPKRVTMPRGDVVVATSPRPPGAAVNPVVALSLPVPKSSMRLVRKPEAS